jgi:hypothetical protein
LVAASRALALIKPGTESRLLVVEGLSRVDDPDDEYEAVDVAEYLGGEDFDSATALIISQLKYSTRHPDQPWTAARLCQRRVRRRADGSAGVARSVIADLAVAFAQLVVRHGHGAVVSKVRIRLVGNQPGDSLLRASIAAAAEWACTNRGGQRAAMLRALTDEQAAVIQMLGSAVGTRLSSAEFCDFLTVLDLSQTGALDRAALARSVRADACELAPGRGPDSAGRLFGHCCIEAKSVLAMHHAGRQDPSGTLENPLNRTSEGLSHGVWGSEWSRSGGPIAQCNSAPGEMLRMLKLAKDSAVKARTQTINQVKAVLVAADPQLREALSA